MSGKTNIKKCLPSFWLFIFVPFSDKSKLSFFVVRAMFRRRTHTHTSTQSIFPCLPSVFPAQIPAQNVSLIKLSWFHLHKALCIKRNQNFSVWIFSLFRFLPSFEMSKQRRLIGRRNRTKFSFQLNFQLSFVGKALSMNGISKLFFLPLKPVFISLKLAHSFSFVPQDKNKIPKPSFST